MPWEFSRTPLDWERFGRSALVIMGLAHRKCCPGWVTHWFRSLKETEPVSLSQRVSPCLREAGRMDPLLLPQCS